MKLASLTTPQSQRLYIRSFGGYDERQPKSGICFSEMENMSGDAYPILSTRKKRCRLALGDGKINNIFSADFVKQGTPYKVIGGALFTDSPQRLRAYFNDGGTENVKNILNTSSFTEQGKKTAVVSGSDLFLFPDAYKVALMDSASASVLECSASYALGSDGSFFYELKFTPCDIDGKDSASSSYFYMTRPYYALNSDGTKGTLQGYMGFNTGFSDGDTVKISGLSNADYNGKYYSIQKIDKVNKKVIFSGGCSLLQSSGTVYISRKVPKMDFVISAKNRLWGCRYGLDELGNSVNEIYASALGDASNWHKFRGVSTDSWTASVGAPGAFTGAITYNGYPVFFKEDCIIKVFGDYPADFTVSESKVRGIESGSSESIAQVNDTLFYKSYSGIVKYDGGLPVNIDAPLGNKRYKNACAGAAGFKYYVSMEDEDGVFHLFVYDSKTGLWHREDNSRAISFCRCGAELYMLDADSSVFGINNCLGQSAPAAAVEEDDFDWYAVTNSLGYEFPEKKYVSSVSFRLRLDDCAAADILLQYDDDGIWHSTASVSSGRGGTVYVSVVPNRCDSFRIKLSGHGGAEILSASITLEKADY